MRHVSPRALAGLLLLAAVALFSGCGVSTTPGTVGVGGSAPKPGASSTPASPKHIVPTPTRPTTPGSLLTNDGGCNAASSDGAVIPDAAVMLPPNRNAQAVTVSVGQTVGVDLPDGFRWVRHLEDPSGALAPVNPQGALDSAHHTCDWRFSAARPGTVTLSFTGVFQCPPHTMCPMLALDRIYTLHVQA